MRPSFRSPLDLRRVAGCLSIVGAMLLASPGVNVRADAGEYSLEMSQNDATCSVGGGQEGTADSGALADQLRRQALAAPVGAASDDVVVLNNQGYNYRSMDGLERATAELERALRER